MTSVILKLTHIGQLPWTHFDNTPLQHLKQFILYKYDVTVTVRTPATTYSGGPPPGGVFPSLQAMRLPGGHPGAGIYDNHGFPPGSVNPAMAAHYR